MSRMTPPHHVDEALEICRVAHVLRSEGAPLDEIEHENAGLCVHHARAKARQMRCLARSQFIGPHDAMDGNVAADPHHVAAPTILDDEVFVGDAAGERRGSTCPNQISSDATRANERSASYQRSRMTLHRYATARQARASIAAVAIPSLLANASGLARKKGRRTGALEVGSAFWGSCEALEVTLRVPTARASQPFLLPL
jgi:hypothetical protein